jgi:hypothetical protein
LPHHDSEHCLTCDFHLLKYRNILNRKGNFHEDWNKFPVCPEHL